MPIAMLDACKCLRKKNKFSFFFLFYTVKSSLNISLSPAIERGEDERINITILYYPVDTYIQ